MPGHDHFDELAVRAAMGELAPEELRELHAHMGSCSKCRAIVAETSVVAAAAFLAGAPVEDSAVKEERRQRARKSVSQQIPVVLSANASKLHRPRLTAGIAAGIAAAFLLGAGFGSALGMNHGGKIAAVETPEPILAHEVIQRAPTQPAASESSPPASQASLLALENQIDRLRAESLVWKDKFSASDQHATELEARLRGMEQQLNAQTQDLTETRNQLTGARGELSQAQQALSANERTVDSLRFKLDDRDAKLTEASASLDRERQMLSAGREIRDIMGARELHIIDVVDRDSKGRVKKPFGRAFYTQGKSLIFYAFDLPAKGTTDGKFVYAAWGSNSNNLNSTAAHNLGVFYSDDQAQRRWAIKFDNPEILKEIDTVFVTLEPAGSPFASPTSKPILEAYFGTPPNHP